MVNLLYDDRLAHACSDAPYSLALDGFTTLHWYGKREARPGRKMGHITAVAAAAAEASRRAHAGLERLLSGDLHAEAPQRPVAVS